MAVIEAITRFFTGGGEQPDPNAGQSTDSIQEDTLHAADRARFYVPQVGSQPAHGGTFGEFEQAVKQNKAA